MLMGNRRNRPCDPFFDCITIKKITVLSKRNKPTEPILWVRLLEIKMIYQLEKMFHF